MKKLLVLGMMTLAAGIVSAASLAEARADIDKVIANPTQMTDTMKGLSAADQKTYLSDVCAAISSMPGSNESKAALYVNVVKAAFKGAAKGNLSTLIAEAFATIPPEALTVLNERLAADVFNRSADPSVTYTDAQYTEIANKVMEVVNERMKTAENGGVRSAFVVLMLVRASNGSPAGLMNTLVDTLPENIREIARKDWLPQAMGEGNNTQTYEPMLGAADAQQQVSVQAVMRLAGPQLLESMLGDIVEGELLINTSMRPEQYASPIKDEVIEQTPPSEPAGYQGQF